MDEQSEVLRSIEATSMSLEIRTRWITEDINRLINLPDWETHAEDALAKAEHETRRALQSIQQSRALLARKRPRQAAE